MLFHYKIWNFECITKQTGEDDLLARESREKGNEYEEN